MSKQQRNEYWQKQITAYRSSGLSMKAWCAANECTLDQLKYWLYRKQKKVCRTSPQAAPVLVPVTATPEATSRPSSLWIEVGHARIEVRPGFKPELLREVVAALR